MKITKSMIYAPSPEATELYLCATNNGDVYKLIQAVYTNLRKKWIKGAYDKNKAITAWYHIATEQSKIYFRDFGYKFSVTERYTAAVQLENTYFDYFKTDENI